MDSNRGKTVTKFKTPKEIEERAAFIAGANAALAGDNWALGDLKKLTNEELLDRLERVSNGAVLMRWRIFWALRQHYASDKLFGQYIQELRENPAYANLVGTQQDIHRAWNAGKFCEKYRIDDITVVGLQISSIYALSRPSNADVAGKVFRKIERMVLPNTARTTLPNVEVERMLYEAKAITVQKEPEQKEPERITYEQPARSGVFKVANNVVQLPEDLEQIGEAIEVAIEHGETVAPVALEAEVIEEPTEEEDETLAAVLQERRAPEYTGRRFTDNTRAIYTETGAEVDLKSVSYDDLLLELASRDASKLTDEQKVSEMILLDERFGMAAIKLIAVHAATNRHYQEIMWGKKGAAS